MSIFTGAGVAIVTPFNEDESINYDKLDQLIDYHCNNGTDSIITVSYTHLDVYKRQRAYTSSFIASS